MTVRTRTRHDLVAASILALALVLTPLVGRSADAVSPGVDVVYIADGRSFADALVGAALAASNNTAVLTVAGTRNGDFLPEATKVELTRLKPKSIVVLGGAAAVSDSVKNELEQYTDPPNAGAVTRLAASDRFGTAVEISKAIPDAVKRALEADEAAYAAQAGDAATLEGHAAEDLAGVFASVHPEPEFNTATAEMIIESVTFTAPADGYVVVTAQSWLRNTTRGDDVLLILTMDDSGPIVDFSQSMGTGLHSPADVDDPEHLTITTAAPVTAGTHTVDLHLLPGGSTAEVDYAFQTIVVQFVPFGDVTVERPS